MSAAPVNRGVWLMLAASLLFQWIHSDSLSVGILVDTTDEDLMRAFHYTLHYHNNRQKWRGIRVTDETLMLPMDNSFYVGAAICQIMTEGIFAFYATPTPNTLNTIESYSATFKMPFVTSGMAVNTTRQEAGYALYIQPYYTRATIDVIKHYGWSEIWYIYCSDEGHELLQQLFEVLTEDGRVLRTHFYRVVDGNDAFETLRRVDRVRKRDKRILLDLPTTECEVLLQKLTKQPRGPHHHYLLVGLGLSEINLDPTMTLGGMNITGFRIVDFMRSSTEKFFKSWSRYDEANVAASGHAIPRTYETALAIDAATVIYTALSNIVRQNANLTMSTRRDGSVFANSTDSIDCDEEPPLPWKHGIDIMKALRETQVNGLSGVIKFDKFGLRRDYSLDIMEVSRNRGLAKIGSWQPTTGFRLMTKMSILRHKGKRHLF